MNTFQDLQARHETLLRRQQANEPILDDVKAYIEQVRPASGQVAALRERDQLRANLRYWAGYVFDQEKVYPTIELAPAGAPPLEIHWGLMPAVAGVVFIALLLVMAGFFFRFVALGLVQSITPTVTASEPNTTTPIRLATGTATPTPLPASPTLTPVPSPTLTPVPSPSPTPAPSQTATPAGVFFELVSPQDGQAVKPREQIVVRYQNIQPDWSLHVLLQPLSQGRRFFPAKPYLTVAANKLSGEWSPTIAFEIGDDLATPQQYTIQLVVVIDEAARKTLTATSASGLQELPPHIPSSKVTTVTRGAYKSVVDEDRLLFALLTSKRSVLFTAKPDGSDAHQLISPGIPAIVNTWAPSLSPSGQQIVFVGTEPDPAQSEEAIYSLWVVDSSGENARPIVRGQTGDVFERPLWSPDGRYIAYTFIPSGYRTSSQIFLYDWQNPGKSPFSVPISYRGCSFPAWFPDRDHLAFAFSAYSRPSILGLLRYDLATGAVTTLLDVDNQAIQPAVSPDGKSIAFMLFADPSSGNRDLYVLDLRTQKIQLVTKPRTGLNQRPQWSPDSESIYFEAFRRKAIPDIWAVHKDGGDEHPVVEDLHSSYPYVGRLVAFFPLR